MPENDDIFPKTPLHLYDMSGDEMTEQDRKRLDALDQKMDDFMVSMGEKFERWDALYYLLVGNKLDAKGSVLSRIADMELWQKEVEKRIKVLEDAKVKIIAYSMAIALVVSSMWELSKLLFSVWTK